MKNQINCADNSKLTLVSERYEENKRYKLYSVQTKEGGFYVIYIYDGNDYVAEALLVSENEVMQLFETICQGGLSCEHLADIVADCKHATIC